MTKLATVRAALQGNSTIQIVSVEELTYFPVPHGYRMTHTVDFVVAPTTGIYTAGELESLMMLLVPGLKPTMTDPFKDYDTLMCFGKLYFDEDIGKESIRREITLAETDFLPSGVVEDGKVIIEESKNLQRRTWVRLYPDVKIAMAAKKDRRYEFEIPRTDLNQFSGRGRKVRFVKSIKRAIAGS